MKTYRLFSTGIVIICSLIAFTHGSDSTTVTQIPPVIALPSAAPATTGNATSQPDRLGSFSVLQKKYLKTVIVNNLLYAAGFGLYRGVVLPRYRKVEGMTETMKLMPLNLLSGVMMYASLPMSAVTSYKARNNYTHYYNEKPRNFTMPLLYAGSAIFIGAAGVEYWQMIKDYKDNKDVDNSYTKYDDLEYALVDAGTLTWVGTNLYSLIYIALLGKKAVRNNRSTSFRISPFHYLDANGLLLSFEY